MRQLNSRRFFFKKKRDERNCVNCFRKKNTELEGRQKQVDKESLMWELYVQGKRSANNEVEIETKNQENMKDRQNRTNIRATGDPK